MLLSVFWLRPGRIFYFQPFIEQIDGTLRYRASVALGAAMTIVNFKW